MLLELVITVSICVAAMPGVRACVCVFADLCLFNSNAGNGSYDVRSMKCNRLQLRAVSWHGGGVVGASGPIRSTARILPIAHAELHLWTLESDDGHTRAHAH